MTERRILLLTLRFGSGHLQASRAIAEELKRQAPAASVRVIDALAVSRLLFRACYEWPYWVMVRHAPALWGSFFERRVSHMTRRTAPEWAFCWGCAEVFKQMARFKPDTILAIEVAACEIATIAKAQGVTTARIINVITDYEAEPAWIRPEVNAYVVPDTEVGQQLGAWGAAIEQLVAYGIPTSRSFRLRHDTGKTRMKYGIPTSVPIVLLMGGGMGPTRMGDVASLLCESRQQMQIVAITGHDRRTRKKLERLRVLPPVRLSVLGWTDEVAALMQAADVLVTKPGGLTIAEAALSGVPLVICDAIPGPEQANAARLLKAGAAIVTTGRQNTAVAVLSLLKDPETRRQMSLSIREMQAPTAATNVAAFALNKQELSPSMPRRMTA